MNAQPTLDLDEFTEPTWEPVWKKSIEDFGWTWSETKSSVPEHPDGTAISKTEWQMYLDAKRCRDCGGLLCNLPTTRGCGGANADGLYELCDDCADVDGLEERQHHMHRCEPRPDHFLSHWTSIAECDDCTLELWSERFADLHASMEREPVPDAEIEAEIAAHNKPFWSGRWGGERLTRAKADLLLARQANRRARYFIEKANS